MTDTLTLDDGDIHVRHDGPRDAPVLLLIHGSASSARSWDALVPLLTASHHVVRPDQARRLAAVLDRLGVGHAVAVGHSSGGAVATALTEQRPDLVSGLALINTGPGLHAFIASGADIAEWPPTDEQIRRFASTGFSRPGYEIPPELLDEVRRMTLHTLTATMRVAFLVGRLPAGVHRRADVNAYECWKTYIRRLTWMSSGRR